MKPNRIVAGLMFSTALVALPQLAKCEDFLRKVIAKVTENAPGVLTTTNMWYYSSMKYFDYSELAYAREIAGNRDCRTWRCRAGRYIEC